MSYLAGAGECGSHFFLSFHSVCRNICISPDPSFLGDKNWGARLICTAPYEDLIEIPLHLFDDIWTAEQKFIKSSRTSKYLLILSWILVLNLFLHIMITVRAAYRISLSLSPPPATLPSAPVASSVQLYTHRTWSFGPYAN